ncbi:hypothetical protein V498_04944 [Pseudogymnoascus sp. VKM F-4517 (FW-2822)]|nr:hypothetical protein V498_04944 [Pseudogymnoascus sp. VKM F-4517 (FW-2822)]
MYDRNILPPDVIHHNLANLGLLEEVPVPEKEQVPPLEGRLHRPREHNDDRGRRIGNHREPLPHHEGSREDEAKVEDLRERLPRVFLVGPHVPPETPEDSPSPSFSLFSLRHSLQYIPKCDTFILASTNIDMKDLNALPGKSGAVSYTCTCEELGYVLLFYRYWANSPMLPEQCLPKTTDPQGLAEFHRQQGDLCSLSGKIRVSKEGFNITVAGSDRDIQRYITACCSHWSFSGLGLGCDTSASIELQDEAQRNKDEFFKPTPGCRCVFEGVLNVRVTAEITPLGVTNYSPSTWEAVQALEPAEFHQKCRDENVKLVDVRNYYESRIGYFVSPTSGEALKPPIRRFSQWPQWVKEHGDKIRGSGEKLPNLQKGKPEVLTYCTGGIRCEKGVRWMEEYMSRDEQRDQGNIYTLKGGIAAYLTWMEAEIAANRKTAEDSLFKGRNYVFDARGSTGLAGAEPVSTCHSCGVPSDRLRLAEEEEDARWAWEEAGYQDHGGRVRTALHVRPGNIWKGMGRVRDAERTSRGAIADQTRST